MLKIVYIIVAEEYHITIGEFYTTIEISRRKTLEMHENTEFLGGVVAKKCYQSDLNMFNEDAAEESAAFAYANGA